MIARALAPIVVVADLGCMNWMWVGMIGIWMLGMAVLLPHLRKPA